MKKMILSGFAALAVAGATTVAAQPYNPPAYSQSGNWDRDTFWRGAPSDVNQRIGFLQTRISRGISDGTLNRREGRSAQRDLERIKYEARRMGRLDARERDILQSRLDELSQRIRWQRQDVSDNRRPSYRDGDRDRDRPSYREAPERYTTDYDASRYYRDDPRYTERRLTTNDEVYRGSDGRYYCKRNDGTTGLIIGAIGGGVLGNVIDGGHQRAAGTLIGGALGAILGQQVDKNSSNNDVRCK